MDHDLELIIPILEILEIEVFNIIYKPGNIGNLSFSIPHILEILENVFFNFLISWKYWIVRSILSPILEILEIGVFNILPDPGNIGKLIFLFFPYPGNIGNMVFLYFGIFTKKTRAEISRRMHRRMSRDLSYETDSGPKTKTVSDPNFQVTAAAATAAAASQQLSHLARALDHHAQGPNIPFGNPSLRHTNSNDSI